VGQKSNVVRGSHNLRGKSKRFFKREAARLFRRMGKIDPEDTRRKISGWAD